MLNERKVAVLIGDYFRSKMLASSKRYNIFNHQHDANERTLIIDLAISPFATKGNRTSQQHRDDHDLFNAASSHLDNIANDLLSISVFPAANNEPGWSKAHNPNPMVGFAVEIENAKSKYFLGSLIAASIAGRWGLLIVPDSISTDNWINTVRRIVWKGDMSPVPSNVIIIKWPAFESYIINSTGMANMRLQMHPRSGEH